MELGHLIPIAEIVVGTWMFVAALGLLQRIGTDPAEPSAREIEALR